MLSILFPQIARIHYSLGSAPLRATYPPSSSLFFVAAAASDPACRYVQQVSKGAQDAAKAHGIAASAAERKKKKEAEEAAAREMAAMFAPAIKQPKPPPGAALTGSCRL